MSTNKKDINKQISAVAFSEDSLPIIQEKAFEKWIGYGAQNDYPQYLINLYQKCSIHSAVVKGVGGMIYGEGLGAHDQEQNEEQWFSLQMLLSKSQKNFLQHCAFDLKLHGYCFINAIWNKTRTKVVEMKHVPAQTIRTGHSNMYGEIETYYYSADWLDYRKIVNKPKGIPAFNTKDRSNPSQLLMIKDYTPNCFYYSTPDYVGSTAYIQLDTEIAEFHLNNVQNGLFPSMMISFNNGIPTDEERMKIERKLLEKFSGSTNAGRVLINFNDGVETKPTVDPITTNGADGLYQFLSVESVNQILSGHRVTSPLIFGVRSEGGGFGNNAQELRDSYSLFNNTVIIPFQNTLLEGLKEILNVNQINLDLYFKTLKPADFLDLDTKEEVVETVEDAAEEEFSEVKDEDVKPLLVELKKYEEKVDYDEWFELGELEVDDEKHEEHFEKFINNKDNNLYKFYGIPQDTPNQKSQSDVGMIRVLYRYSQNIAANTRPFCRGMVQASKGGAKYTVNNLKTMSSQSLNPDFAHTGSTYDIWAWKGGVFCHHKWVRLFYLRKRVPVGEIIDIGGKIYKGGQYLPAGTLDNFKKSYQAELNKLGFNWSKVRGMEPKYTTAAPIHTPLRGAFPGGRFAPGK